MRQERIILSQTCTHCFEVMSFIYQNNILDKMAKRLIKVDMINQENEFAVEYMKRALTWLADNVDREMYENQVSATPMYVRESIDGIEEIIVGSEEIMEFLRTI